MRVVVRIESGPDGGQERTLQPGQVLLVGRSQPADWVFAHDARMGSKHFAIEWDSGAWRLKQIKARHGTRLNGAKVTEAILKDGDRIEAGTTTFALRMEGTGVAAATAGVPDRRRRVLEILRKETEPTYVLLDAARSPQVLMVLRLFRGSYACLYDGEEAEMLAPFAPYLALAPAASPFVETLLMRGWGKSWGVFLTCPQPLAEVREHLRRFILVTDEDGKQMYFRFYDPRVLRTYLPSCDPEEATRFFGPITSFILEDQDGANLLRFHDGPKGARRELVSLGPLPAGPQGGNA